ncbi:protein-L-isoaspartate(D-aspartate) O-methyltransferase [Streptosporangium sp. NPDC051022]|uniref:protein-L-isoaspartate O-methyltransferase family protein n=1 Tax=Streptosporangium sp. NPDC051022 TaxID=3155752 RepID=UPI0034260006
MDWKPLARRLADEVVGPGSRWHSVIAAIPRHLLVPRWWSTPDDGKPGAWQLRDGPLDERVWSETAYHNLSLVTAVAGLHADHATPDDTPAGEHTSSSAMPSLVLRMIRHARLTDDSRTLIVGTGSGYPAALLASRYGDAHVTSVDLDSYLTRAATERLAAFGLYPALNTLDALGPLPGTFERVISMTGVRPIPAGWLHALRPGGRLVTTIAGTHLILTATADTDGPGARGRIELDRATFTPAAGTSPGRTAQTSPDALRDGADTAPGRGRYPVTRIRPGSEMATLLELHAPGIRHHYVEASDGRRTVTMTHSDGSYARAVAHGSEPPATIQAGPHRLWDLLDDIRHLWITRGTNPLYGARAVIDADGAIHLSNREWSIDVR